MELSQKQIETKEKIEKLAGIFTWIGYKNTWQNLRYKMKTLMMILSLFVFGCVTTTPFQRYDEEMTRVSALRLTETQKARVIEYGESFWLSYHQALDDLEALLGYTRTLR